MFPFHSLRAKPKPKIELVLGDICLQEVDVIVNAADETLLGGTGVDGAIREAAGPEVSMACRALAPMRNGPVITPGFNLPAGSVIHAAAPVWTSACTNDHLAKVFAQCIELASANRARSIAFPLLGAGAFGWDAEDVAVAAKKGCQIGCRKACGIDLIRIVAFSARGMTVLEQVFGLAGIDQRAVRIYHAGHI